MYTLPANEITKRFPKWQIPNIVRRKPSSLRDSTFYKPDRYFLRFNSAHLHMNQQLYAEYGHVYASMAMHIYIIWLARIYPETMRKT